MAARVNRVQASKSMSVTESISMSPDLLMGKSVSITDDVASTDAGDDSPYTDASTSPRTMTSFEDFSDSEASRTPTSEDLTDSELGEECKAVASDDMHGDCVYSILFLLQMRAAVTVSRSVVRTCRQPTVKAPMHRSPESKPQADPFKASQTSWVSQQRLLAQGTRNDDEKVVRAARSLLNKLTVEKFESIFEQLANCGMKTPEHITILMHEVFEKATSQHPFIPMYADLCVRLEGDTRTSSVVGPDGEQQSFRRLLLNQCQIRFEQLLEPSGSEDSCEEEVKARRKKQALGNVKLIGELLVRGMLSSNLLVECAEQLLQNQKICPEALESLATLLTVAGSTFDNTKYRYHTRLNAIISAVRELTRDKSTPARARFLLQDLLDMRDASWSTSKSQAAVRAAPKRLEEVREEAEGELRKCCNDIPTRAPKPSYDKDCGVCNKKPYPGKASNGYARSDWKPTWNNKSRYYEQSRSKGESWGNANYSKNDQVPLQRESKTPAPPPGFESKTPAPPPGFTAPRTTEPVAAPYTAVSFRREVTATLRDLGVTRNVVAAVGRMRAQQVPVSCQAKEFADIITRTAEESRSPMRRLAFAFVAALASGDNSAFDRMACLEGLRMFFDEVYSDLCDDVPRLPGIVKSELFPTLSNVFASSDLQKLLPNGS